MSQQGITAVYPGSFDPFHLGHLDIVRRALTIFPRVVVGVLENTDKTPLLSAEDRVELIRATLRGMPGVEVTSFSGLLVDFMKQTQARVILRGMRAVSDFEYEFQIALMNRRLWHLAETVFLTPNEEFTYLSGRVVREIWHLGGDVSGLVPEPVRQALAALRR
ncbi:MAG TPA: pantetheine-phosphate adenylyltransferase [Thermoanaerobaculaceae bacterium]|nr:pantetheine-phosphate adenylyltransferase [Thermoanaerobaculaceae bacterium]